VVPQKKKKIPNDNKNVENQKSQSVPKGGKGKEGGLTNSRCTGQEGKGQRRLRENCGQGKKNGGHPSKHMQKRTS